MFPSTVYRQAYDQLVKDDPVHASRRYLQILEWAALNSETAIEGSLQQLLDADEPFTRLYTRAGAANICFVAGNIERVVREQFDLIGLQRMFFPLASPK